MTTDGPLELLDMDLFRPIASIGGSKYCLVIVDDYSRFTWVFFLQEKSQTQETLKGFLRQAQNEFGLRIKKIRSDNGTEFKNFQEDNGANGRLFSNPNGWVTWRRTGQCPVAHRTVSGGAPYCPVRPSTTAFPNDHLVVEGYKYPPTTTTPSIQAF
jgi:transposase InsO family protein